MKETTAAEMQLSTKHLQPDSFPTKESRFACIEKLFGVDLRPSATRKVVSHTVEMTPEQAGILSKMVHPNQRPVHEPTVRKMVRDRANPSRDGKSGWIHGFDVLVFTDSCFIIDGQQRLASLSRMPEGYSCWVTLNCGCPDTVYTLIKINQKKNLHVKELEHFMQCDDHDSFMVASYGSIIMAQRRSTLLSGQHMPKEDRWRTWEQNRREISDCLDKARDLVSRRSYQPTYKAYPSIVTVLASVLFGARLREGKDFSDKVLQKMSAPKTAKELCDKMTAWYQDDSKGTSRNKVGYVISNVYEMVCGKKVKEKKQ